MNREKTGKTLIITGLVISSVARIGISLRYFPEEYLLYATVPGTLLMLIGIFIRPFEKKSRKGLGG